MRLLCYMPHILPCKAYLMSRLKTSVVNINVNRIVSITSVIYLIFIFAFASGTIHALVEGNRTGQNVLIIPDRSTQTMGESVLSILLFLFGSTGVFFVHRSAKPQAVKAQKMFFIAGFSIMAIALLSSFLLLEFKL